MPKKKCFLAVLFALAISLLTALPSFAMVGELEVGKSWRYAVKLNGQLFCLNKVTVTGREDTEAKTIWMIKDEYFYKVIFEEKNQEYQGEQIVRLSDDYTLISAKDTTNLNRHFFISTSIEKDEDGYVITEKKRTGRYILLESRRRNLYVSMIPPTLG